MEQWKMHRLGFRHFWLYDKEDFIIEDGHLLLRGSNASGKSITTQSFIPFILDGNRSPERLDPFGSRDRKMDYYLLGDGKYDESTGYLFLEFKKKDLDVYLTIGIGLRAQKGKSMDFWGFCLNDGRRIGYDFELYEKLGKQMSKDFQSTAASLNKAIWAMDTLENHSSGMLRLSVFSAMATTDPHALDSDTICGQMFLHLLSRKRNRPYPAGAEERDEVYFENGILCDSISSTVTQVGLILSEQQVEHPAFEAFRQRKECCTLSLANLNVVSSVASPSGKAYLIENQMLFSQLCDHARYFQSPLICTSGQLQVAVLRLLDMLAASGTTLYYAGDFDGGGISIAARLLARYPDNLQLWHMTAEDYEVCKSEVSLSENSRNLLKTANGTILESIADTVQRNGYAGYQELLLDRLLPDLTATTSVSPELVFA